MAEHKIVSIDRDMLLPNGNPTEEHPKLESVVNNGKVARTAPSLGKRIKSLFISDDTGDMKSWLLYDVAIPFVKDTILDMIEMAFFGQTRGRRGSRSGSRVTSERRDYRAEYRPKSEQRSRRSSGYSQRDEDEYRNIVLTDRYDAKAVVDKLQDRISEYGNATVADLFSLVGTTSRFTDTCYGWTNPNQIGIKRVNDGYLIDVDVAEALDD